MSRNQKTQTRFETIPIETIPPAALQEIKVGQKAKRRKHIADPLVPKLKTVRVLVVDDNEEIAHSLMELLDLNGYQCFAAYNAQDAIAAAESFTPDVVLSDVIMAGDNGIDACMRIKRELPACRVLLYSGQISVAHSLLQDAAKSGYSFELISKPVDPQALVAKIELLFTGPHAAIPAAQARV
jgi:DNA-binding NtrC family response regulator